MKLAVAIAIVIVIAGISIALMHYPEISPQVFRVQFSYSLPLTVAGVVTQGGLPVASADVYVFVEQVKCCTTKQILMVNTLLI